MQHSPRFESDSDRTSDSYDVRMRQYHRFMNFASEQLGQAALEEALRNAPGASEVTILGVHPKGGYRAQLELAPDAIDDFIAYLDAKGWRSVL